MDKKEWEAILERAEKLVALFEKDKDEMVKMYLTENKTLGSHLIKQLKLTKEQRPIFEDIVDLLLCETYRTVLYAIDGSASIGGVQQMYKLYDQEDNLISDCGYLEGAIGNLEAFEDRYTKRKEGKI